MKIFNKIKNTLLIFIMFCSNSTLYISVTPSQQNDQICPRIDAIATLPAEQIYLRKIHNNSSKLLEECKIDEDSEEMSKDAMPLPLLIYIKEKNTKLVISNLIARLDLVLKKDSIANCPNQVELAIQANQDINLLSKLLNEAKEKGCRIELWCDQKLEISDGLNNLLSSYFNHDKLRYDFYKTVLIFFILTVLAFGVPFLITSSSTAQMNN